MTLPVNNCTRHNRVNHRHWCGHDDCPGNVPAKELPFCNEASPFTDADLTLKCMRIAGHDGAHRVYTDGPHTPAEWGAA